MVPFDGIDHIACDHGIECNAGKPDAVTRHDDLIIFDVLTVFGDLTLF